MRKARHKGEDRPPRHLRLVVAAHAVSTYGSFLNMVALGLFTLELTGSTLQTGMFMAVRLIAGFLMGPVAGVLVGRYPRAYLMIGSDLLSATTLALLVVVPSDAQPTVLYGLAVVLGAGQTLSGVALRSGLPDLIPPDQLARANGTVVTARSTAMLLGFGTAGVLVTVFGYHTALLLDAASYLLSALLLAAVPGWRSTAGRSAGHPEPPAVARPALRIRGALTGIAPMILAMIAVRTADAFGSASHNVGLPVYANLAQPDSPAAFAAMFTTAWAVGSLVVGRWYARSAATAGTGSPRAFGFATCAMSVLFGLAFTAPPAWLLIALALAAGVADGYAEISYTTRLQGVDPSRRAQLFGFATAAQNGGFGLGMIGSAFALEHLAPLVVVATAHGLALGAALFFLATYARTPAPPPARPTAQKVEMAA